MDLQPMLIVAGQPIGRPLFQAPVFHMGSGHGTVRPATDPDPGAATLKNILTLPARTLPSLWRHARSLLPKVLFLGALPEIAWAHAQTPQNSPVFTATLLGCGAVAALGIFDRNAAYYEKRLGVADNLLRLLQQDYSKTVSASGDLLKSITDALKLANTVDCVLRQKRAEVFPAGYNYLSRKQRILEGFERLEAALTRALNRQAQALSASLPQESGTGDCDASHPWYSAAHELVGTSCAIARIAELQEHFARDTLAPLIVRDRLLAYQRQREELAPEDLVRLITTPDIFPGYARLAVLVDAIRSVRFTEGLDLAKIDFVLDQFNSPEHSYLKRICAQVLDKLRQDQSVARSRYTNQPVPQAVAEGMAFANFTEENYVEFWLYTLANLENDSLQDIFTLVNTTLGHPFAGRHELVLTLVLLTALNANLTFAEQEELLARTADWPCAAAVQALLSSKDAPHSGSRGRPVLEIIDNPRDPC